MENLETKNPEFGRMWVNRPQESQRDNMYSKFLMRSLSIIERRLKLKHSKQTTVLPSQRLFPVNFLVSVLLINISHLQFTYP